MDTSFKKLLSADPKVISEGIKEIAVELKNKPDQEELSIIFDALTSLFYLDTFDRPDLRQVREQAQAVVVSMGTDAIPLIMERQKHTDFKAELVFAQTCGLMGEKVIQPLEDYYYKHDESFARAFILYAFGKIRSSKIVNVLPTIIQSVKSPSRELEDTAVRALGKVCESINPKDVDDTTRDDMFNALAQKLTHPNDVIRSKAVRSLGKMVRYGITDELQNDHLRAKTREILGLEEEDQAWDYAYLVRREAQEVLNYLK